MSETNGTARVLWPAGVVEDRAKIGPMQIVLANKDLPVRRFIRETGHPYSPFSVVRVLQYRFDGETLWMDVTSNVAQQPNDRS